MNEKLIAVVAIAILALELYWLWLTEPLGKFLFIVIGMAVAVIWSLTWAKFFDSIATNARYTNQQEERCRVERKHYCISSN